MLTGTQIRMARAALRMEQAELAQKAGISVDSVKRAEGFDGEPKAQPSTMTAIQRVFELAGLDFEGGGVAVSVRRGGRRYARLIMEITSEIENFVGMTLMLEFGSDPEFFNKGADHVASKLQQSFRAPLLKTLVRRVMPDSPRAAP